MGLTPKEKQARYRERMRAQRPDHYENQKKKKDRERHLAKWRARRAEMSKQEIEEDLIVKRMEKRKQRAAKKVEAKRQDSATEIPGPSPFSSRQAQGKAMKKATVNLSQSPRKCLYVVQAIANQEGFTVSGNGKAQHKLNSASITESARKLVIEHYNSNDISWQAPGRKDRVIIRGKTENGKTTKMTIQARYMVMSLKEAHKAFSTKYPDEKVGLSKFCELRPEHIKLSDKIPHNVQVKYQQRKTSERAEKVLLLATPQEILLELRRILPDFLLHVYIKRQQAAYMDRKIADCSPTEIVLQQHSIKLEWNFFVTSHGKGAVDGIGGTVKRSVWRYVKAGHASVQNANKYAAIASQRNPGPNQISVAETSSGPFIDAQIREANMDVNYEQSPPEDLLTLANDQLLLVNYDGANYPGEVVEISEEQQEVKVNTMESAANENHSCLSVTVTVSLCYRMNFDPENELMKISVRINNGVLPKPRHTDPMDLIRTFSSLYADMELLCRRPIQFPEFRKKRRHTTKHIKDVTFGFAYCCSPRHLNLSPSTLGEYFLFGNDFGSHVNLSRIPRAPSFGNRKQLRKTWKKKSYAKQPDPKSLTPPPTQQPKDENRKKEIVVPAREKKKEEALQDVEEVIIKHKEKRSKEQERDEKRKNKEEEKRRQMHNSIIAVSKSAVMSHRKKLRQKAEKQNASKTSEPKASLEMKKKPNESVRHQLVITELVNFNPFDEPCVVGEDWGDCVVSCRPGAQPHNSIATPEHAPHALPKNKPEIEAATRTKTSKPTRTWTLSNNLPPLAPVPQMNAWKLREYNRQQQLKKEEEEERMREAFREECRRKNLNNEAVREELKRREFPAINEISPAVNHNSFRQDLFGTDDLSASLPVSTKNVQLESTVAPSTDQPVYNPLCVLHEQMKCTPGAEMQTILSATQAMAVSDPPLATFVSSVHVSIDAPSEPKDEKYVPQIDKLFGGVINRRSDDDDWEDDFDEQIGFL
ncbi:hypothetical protein CAPTEDRAFT_193886 [Capitella teleta]|uniref:Uncharacterized protein n=1 Tax=Capitella teleta TaxID=283909 RepID=R7V6T5_CAPTE|nr:hypothetical protein CAPTEDRAFT_193886 [Capitella teleta]|eukprot:ELU11480.1 hypothetical protein CAPTEDRAFT_193886 [Capitella teleta]